MTPHIDQPVDVERLRLVEQLRARRVASIARGSKLAILMQAAGDHAEAEQREGDQREAARMRQLLDLDVVEAAPPREPVSIPDHITPDTPLPLELAARVAFPTGTMGVSGLRNEIKKGNLPASKVAGRIFTTLGNITRMIEKCRIEVDDAAGAQSSISGTPSDRETHGDGSSSTSRPTASASSSAQAHLNQIAQRLRKPSANTSPQSTSPSSAQVVPIKR